MMNYSSLKSVQPLAVRALVAIVLASLFAYVNPASAAQLTSAKDTMTRLAASTTADHVIVFTLPGTVEFDEATPDNISIDFDQANYTQNSGWVNADFALNDGTARTIYSTTVGAGAQTPNCVGSAGANDIAVTVDTTNFTFGFTPCGTFTDSALGATVTITIYGTSTTGAGTLTNPAAIASYTTSVTMSDDGTTPAHAASIVVPIVEDDTVTINAAVDATLTFDLDVAYDTSTEGNPATNPVNLGTLTTGAVTTSNHTTVKSVWMDIDTNASGGFVVTVVNTDANVDLASASVPTDEISAVSGGPVQVTAGTEGYGICVVAATATTGTITKAAKYIGDGSNDGCTASTSDNYVGTPPAAGTAETIVSAAAGPIVAGDIEIAVKAAIDSTTQAHNDYTDSVRFIATGTF